LKREKPRDSSTLSKAMSLSGPDERNQRLRPS
jgi:hypothetical protein